MTGGGEAEERVAGAELTPVGGRQPVTRQLVLKAGRRGSQGAGETRPAAT